MGGVLNARAGTFALARAGVPNPVYIPAAGEPTALTVPGPFLGTPNTAYQTLTGTLGSGDRLLMGTDGTRPDGAPTPGGPDRLLEVAGKHRALAGEEFVDAVARELLQQARHADDFTLLGLEML
ncbi:MAG: PP2C family protein-serine/threonine phosphatase, partial [Gemmata sp.]